MLKLTSRERMLRAVTQQPVDHTPCCFMSFTALGQRLKEDRYEVAKAQLAMGLDALLFIPAASRAARPEHPDLRGLPIRLPEDVRTEKWREDNGAKGTLLHRAYHTPRGSLTTTVALSEDWPHGAHIPFIDDYQIPRSVKPLIATAADLEVLDYLLQPPTVADVAAFQVEAAKAASFANAHGILLAGGWGVGWDMANWLCGMQNLMVSMMERPSLVDDLLELIHRWNMARMEVVLSAPVDLYLRRAWYEGCDFVTPRFYKQSILPRLKREVDLAHSRGTKFGYICTSGTKPMLDSYLDAGFDVLLGIDPEQGTYTDMPLIQEKLSGKICLWGGVSGAITVEMGSPEEIRAAVDQAIRTFGHAGFILSPIDNITVDAPRTWENIDVFIDAWRQSRREEAE
jgi:uroporphyrinogen-III decarboxylase